MVDASVNHHSPPAVKISLFRSLFADAMTSILAVLRAGKQVHPAISQLALTSGFRASARKAGQVPKCPNRRFLPVTMK
jgi:hypothetical protein